VLPRGAERTLRILADQRRARAALVAERERAAEALAGLKVERTSVQARATIAESEMMPLPYAAELLGMGTDDEKAIRRLIALMVLGYDPLAIALTAAASAWRLTTI
jgi:HEAT repeat protein